MDYYCIQFPTSKEMLKGVESGNEKVVLVEV